MGFLVIATREFTIPGFRECELSPMVTAKHIITVDSFHHNTPETAQKHADKNNATLKKYGGDCWVVEECTEASP